MKLEMIKDLMRTFNESDLNKLNVDFDGIHLELEKNTTGEHIVMREVTTVTPKVIKEVVTPKESSQTVKNGEEIKSPLVGVFYSKSSPTATAFVEVGSKVQAGDTLCIIEAMKVMNEIKAPISGTVTEILVSDEQLVEFDQVIMVIGE